MRVRWRLGTLEAKLKGTRIIDTVAASPRERDVCMKVIIRRPRREVEIPGSRRVRDLLRELQINPETVLVVRGQDLLTPDELVKDDETVEVVSAISGGSNDEV